MDEFMDCGPRVVRQDDDGFFVKYRGDKVYAPALSHWLGKKVHVMASLNGDGWSIAEWLQTTRIHPGGWRARSGPAITGFIYDKPKERQVW